MSVFTYHLLQTSVLSGLKSVFFPRTQGQAPGLLHMERMHLMTLGAPVFSTSRLLLRQLAVFAQWEDENAVDDFLKQDRFGRMLDKGWHLRLALMRQWGSIHEFRIADEPADPTASDPAMPVVAVTLARMRLPEVPRFIRWGRQTEMLVRDHPGAVFSLASIRFPRTVSTFSVWKTQQDMLDMVRGHSAVPEPGRHIDAMRERERKDFHFEFTTLRFRALSEHGSWKASGPRRRCTRAFQTLTRH